MFIGTDEAFGREYLQKGGNGGVGWLRFGVLMDDFMGGQLFAVTDGSELRKENIGNTADVEEEIHRALLISVFNPEQPAGEGGRQGEKRTEIINNRREDMQPGAADTAGIQDADGEYEKHISPGEVKKEEQHAEKPQEPGRVFGTGFMQARGNCFEDLGADINGQDGEKRTVQEENLSVKIVSICKLKRYIFDGKTITRGYIRVKENFTKVCTFDV